MFGEAAYGTGEFQQFLEDNQIASGCRTQPPTAPGDMFAKDRFAIDLETEITVTIRRGRDGTGTAHFGHTCTDCDLRPDCTTAKNGRTISVGIHEAALARARTRQQDPTWQTDYRATRPKVERKLGHMMRRRHGGRVARMRGTTKVDADFNLFAAATNLARLATLGLHSTPTSWATA